MILDIFSVLDTSNNHIYDTSLLIHGVSILFLTCRTQAKKTRKLLKMQNKELCGS